MPRNSARRPLRVPLVDARVYTTQQITARDGTARHGTAQHSTAQQSRAWRQKTIARTTCGNESIPNTAQHSTARHSTAQHSMTCLWATVCTLKTFLGYTAALAAYRPSSTTNKTAARTAITYTRTDTWSMQPHCVFGTVMHSL